MFRGQLERAESTALSSTPMRFKNYDSVGVVAVLSQSFV